MDKSFNYSSDVASAKLNLFLSRNVLIRCPLRSFTSILITLPIPFLPTDSYLVWIFLYAMSRTTAMLFSGIYSGRYKLYQILFVCTALKYPTHLQNYLKFINYHYYNGLCSGELRRE